MKAPGAKKSGWMIERNSAEMKPKPDEVYALIVTSTVFTDFTWTNVKCMQIHLARGL